MQTTFPPVIHRPYKPRLTRFHPIVVQHSWLLAFLRLLVIASFVILLSASQAGNLPLACSSHQVCILFLEVMPIHHPILQSAIKELSAQVSTLFTQSPVENFDVRHHPINFEKQQFTYQQARALSRAVNAQFIIWGEIVGERGKQSIRLQTYDALSTGDSPQIRPVRIQSFFYQQLQEQIFCGTCQQLDSIQQQQLASFAHTVAGLTYYANGWPEQANHELLTVLTCEDATLDLAVATAQTVPCVPETPTVQNHGLLYYYAGKSSAFQGDYERAIALLEKASTYAPADPAPIMSIGAAYQEWLADPQAGLVQTEYEHATTRLTALQTTLHREQHQFINYNLGIIAEAQGQSQSAHMYFQNASIGLPIESSSRYAILLGLARSQQQKGEIKEAISTLKEAYTLAPDGPWALLALAKLYQYEPELARHFIDQAKQVAKYEAYVDLTLAELCESWQEYTCAAQAYENALTKRPSSGWLHGRIGQFYLPTNPVLPHQSWDEAEAHFRLVANSLRPNDPWSHEQLAYVLANQHSYDESVKHYQRAIDLAYPGMVPARLYCNLGEAQQRLGLLSDAKTTLELCAKLSSH